VNIFNIFKSKKKVIIPKETIPKEKLFIKEQLRVLSDLGINADLVNECINLWGRGKYIKKSELLSIPDSELENIVLGWIWGKFNDEWSNDYEVISSLPGPCQNFYSCHTVSGDIFNGGINQLFFNYNSTGKYAEMAIEGFNAMGSHRLSEILKEAVARFKEHKPTLDNYNDGTLESFSASYNEAVFDDLDEAFCREHEDVNYLNYIKKNIEYFGN